MTYFADHSDPIDRVNNQALSMAIGEQLQVSFDQERIEMPPNLISLLKQLRLSEIALATR